MKRENGLSPKPFSLFPSGQPALNPKPYTGVPRKGKFGWRSLRVPKALDPESLAV